jgi:hypothetical protein
VLESPPGQSPAPPLSNRCYTLTHVSGGAVAFVFVILSYVKPEFRILRLSRHKVQSHVDLLLRLLKFRPSQSEAFFVDLLRPLVCARILCFIENRSSDRLRLQPLKKAQTRAASSSIWSGALGYEAHSICRSVSVRIGSLRDRRQKEIKIRETFEGKKAKKLFYQVPRHTRSSRDMCTTGPPMRTGGYGAGNEKISYMEQSLSVFR